MFLYFAIALLISQMPVIHGMRVESSEATTFAAVCKSPTHQGRFIVSMHNHFHGDRFQMPLVFQSESKSNTCIVDMWYKMCTVECLQKAIASVKGEDHKLELKSNWYGSKQSLYRLAISDQPLSSQGFELKSFRRKKQLTQK